MTTNLDRMHAVDRAWNARRWDDYAAHFADDLVAWMAGDEHEHDKAQHLRNAEAFCATYPDARVVMESYVDLFLSADETRTCSIARLTGTAASVGVASTGRRFDVAFIVVSEWRDGRIVCQREFVDNASMLRQLEKLPEADPHFADPR
jgi:ketosteroid isomerase-like protein